MSLLFAGLVVFLWIAASSKPAQGWAANAPKGRARGKEKGVVATTIIDLGGGRSAIKYGDYRVGYLAQRDGMWVALNLRGGEEFRAASRDEVVSEYIHSIGGSESRASWLR